MLLPLGDEPPEWGRQLLSYSIGAAVKFFPFALRLEDPAAVEVKRPYVVGETALPARARSAALAFVACAWSAEPTNTAECLCRPWTAANPREISCVINDIAFVSLIRLLWCGQRAVKGCTCGYCLECCVALCHSHR